MGMEDRTGTNGTDRFGPERSVKGLIRKVWALDKSEKTRQSYRNSCAYYKAAFATCLIFGVVGLPLTFLGFGDQGGIVFLHRSWTQKKPTQVVEHVVEQAVEHVVETVVLEEKSLEAILLENLRSLDGPAPETVKEVEEGQWQVKRMKVTAYCPCRICCGKHADGVTACNHRIRPGDVFVAADKSISFGTEMKIPGYNANRPVEVKDRGRLIVGNRLDVFMHSHQQAKQWGCRELDVLVKVD